jgi:hypothetical protein
MSNGEISFYVDTLLVETVLSEPHFYKKAGFVSDLLTKVKDYFGSKIDKSDPAGSVLNEIAPGALWVLFQALGIGKWGMLLGLLMEVFHVDVKGMLSSLYNKVKGMISGGEKVSSAQIDQAVSSTVQEHNTPPTPEEEKEGMAKLQQMQGAQPAQADDGRVYSSLELLRDAKMISLSLIEYERQSMRLTKSAGLLGGFFGTKSKGTSLLGSVFGWIIKIALASAGLMVAGDIVNKFMGRPNSLDGTYQPGKSEEAAPQGPVSSQNKYQLKGDAPLSSSMPIVNNPENIDNMLVQFAKDVYSGLDGKDSLIRNTAGFQMVKERLVWYNTRNAGSALTFIPKEWHSKKQLVDYFIDDVAKADQA